MYKLTGHSLQRGVWFEPESQPMMLTERTSTSSITLGPDAPEIGFNDWLLDDEWPEGPIVWRVKSIDDQTDTETVTVSLEHVIRLLEDTKLFDDVATNDIAGGDYCTARQAVEYLIARQSDWVLGDCLNDVSLPYEFNGGDSLLDAIESVSETLEDAEWWYDLSQYPFVLHIRRRSSAAMSEMRGGRNVSTLRRSINRSGMYTRIWPVGKNDLHISGDYISKNESLYGRVDKVETNQGKTTEDGLRAWANGLLRRHCEPLVTITISGLELSQETGEALDRIRLNRVCRCPLPEFRTTILERVIKIQWRDRKKDPESVTVTLGNNAADVRDLTKTVEETSKSSGRGARGQAKQNYLFEANGEHLLYEVFDECGHLHGILRMTSESLRTAFENLNECTRSEFLLTSESMRVQFENEINSTRSEFQMTSESMRVEFENEVESVRSQVEQTDRSWKASVAGVAGADGKVTAASIGVAINESGSEAYIDAEHIKIGSNQTVDVVINSLVTRVNTLEADTVTTNNLSAKIASLSTVSVNALTASGNISATGAVIGSGVYIGSSGAYTDVGNAIATFGVAQENDGSITIPTTKLNGGQGTPINFNIAATQYFIDGVAANRASDVGSVQTTEETAIQLLSEYNTKYKIQTRYKRYNGTWANGSSYVVLTPVDRYQTGYNDGKPTGATLGSKTATTGIYYNVLVTKGDGGQQAFEVDLSAAYTAARSGYTLGTFTPASVTLQGAAYGDITPIGKAVTPTTYNVTLQGSEVTVNERYTTAYKTSTLGYYPRGSRYSGTLYTNGTNQYTGTLYVGGSYTEVTVVGGSPGSGVNLYKNKGSNTYRNSGSAATYYDVGSNATLYKAGTKISGLRQAGTTIANTYYTKS